MPNIAIRHRRLGEIVRKAECPNCNRFIYCAESDGCFDAHGFESYQSIVRTVRCESSALWTRRTTHCC